MQPYSSGTGNIDPNAGSDVLDLRTVISVIRINLKLLLAVFAVVFLLGVAYTFTLPSKYTSSASVMVGAKAVKVNPGAADAAADQPADSAQVDTEAEILKSLAIAEAVTKSTNLESDPEFNPTLKKGGGLLSFLHPKKAGPATPEAVHQVVLDNLLRAVNVKRQGLTRIITVSIETGSPIKSAKLADAWMAAYMNHASETKANALSDVNGQLSKRLEDLRTEANDADAKVEQYKIAHGLTSDGDSALPEQQLYFLKQQLALADMEVADTQARLAAARRSGASIGANDTAQASDTLAALRNQQAVLSTNLAQLSSRYGPMHPEVIKAKQALDAINVQIQAESGRQVSHIQTDADAALQKQRSLRAALGAAHGTINNSLSSNVELRDLQLAASTAHTVYEGYLQRFKDIGTQEGLDAASARVISAAKVPTSRSSPKMSLALLMSAIVAGFMSAVAVGIKYAMRRGLSSGTEVTNQLGVPFLGNVAELNSTLKTPMKSNVKLWDYLEANPMSVFAEQYKILASAVNIGTGANAKRVVAVTSAIPGEGKTTTSMCLGKTIQMRGQSVVVVDCDLRRRSVTAQLGKTFDFGVVEVLEGAVPLQKALYDGGHGVMYLPVSNGPVPTENVFGGNALTDMLTELQKHFDVVVMDTAPVLPIVDTRVLVHHVDTVLVLAKWNDTPVGATRTALDILHNEGVNNIAGVALTVVDIRKQAMLSGANSEYYYNSYKSYYVQ